jgi:hypothetical protein
MPNKPESTPGRLESILAYMAVAVIGLSIVSIAVSLISAWNGASANLAVWAQIPLIGLPLGMLLIISLLIVSLRRRTRSKND